MLKPTSPFTIIYGSMDARVAFAGVDKYKFKFDVTNHQTEQPVMSGGCASSLSDVLDVLIAFDASFQSILPKT